jgi:hypothetical protein
MQLLNAGKKVRGVDFISLASTAFEHHILPVADVVLLHNVGMEVSVNFNVSKQVFTKVRKFYSERNVLLVMETELTKQELSSKYDYLPVNYLKLVPKSEETWV